METVDRLLHWRRRILMKCRRFRYRLKGVHRTAYICTPIRVKKDLMMGAYSFVNEGCMLNANVEIGRYVMLGPRVVIVGGDHRYDLPGVPSIFSGRGTIEKTVIEDDVWLGYGVVVMSGVRIGRGTVVAAGSIVTKDIPAYEIHAGVPCKKIRDRFDAEQKLAHNKMLDGDDFKGKYCRPKNFDL